MSHPSSRPAARPAKQATVNRVAARAARQQSHAVEKNNREATPANIQGSAATRATFSSRQFIALSTVAAFVLLASSILVIHASLTLNSSTVSSDGTLNLTGVGTSTIDVGSSTLNLQTTNSGPVTFGNGVTTVPNASGTNETLSGYLTVAGASTFNGTVIANAITTTSTDGTASISNFNVNGEINPQTYGAVGDGRVLYDGAMDNNTTATLTSASGKFASTDCHSGVGCTGATDKAVYVYNAGASGTVATGTVVGYTSATQVTLSFKNTSGAAISGKQFGWGTDNATALQSAVTAAETLAGRVVRLPPGLYFDSTYLAITSTIDNTIRITGAAAKSTPSSGSANLFAVGSAILFIGTAGTANTQCSAGATSGAIRLDSPLRYNTEKIEIDHLFLEYSNPGLGCVIVATNEGGDINPLFNIHDNTIQGTMTTAASGQLTAGIYLDANVEDTIARNTFANLGKAILNNNNGMNSVTIKENLFLPLLISTNYQITLNTGEAVTVLGNTFEVTPNGIFLNGACEGCAIQGNWFGDAVTNSGRWIYDGPFIGTISGNEFEGAQYQILIVGDAGRPGKIFGNHFYNYGTEAVNVGGSSEEISNNRFDTGVSSSEAVETSGEIDAWDNGFIGTNGGSYLLNTGATGLIQVSAADQTTNKITDNSGGKVIMISGGTLTAKVVNSCRMDVTLSSGSGTFSNACVTTASACNSTDITTPANACTVAAPTAGSVAITGTGTDVCRTWCE
jgi:hypothetical protein